MDNKFLAFILVSILSISSWAAENASVLPKGIYRARLVSAFTNSVFETFNKDGLLEPLSASLNRSVTISDFVAQQPELGQLVSTLNNLSPGLGNELLNANLFNDFEITAQQYLPAIEKGITKRLTLGARIPIVHRSVVNNFSVEATNNAQFISQLVGGLSPQLTQGLSQAQAAAINTQLFEQNLFTSKGYEAPASFSSTDLGDLEFGGKYNFYTSKKLKLTTQIGFRVPTGKDPSLTNIFDKGTSAGSWATAALFFQEYFFSPQISINFFQKFLYNFSDTKLRAVPKDASDNLPSLLVEDGQVQSVTRSQAPRLELEVALNTKFKEGAILAWTALRYETQGKSSFDGPGNLFYQGLTVGTDSNKTTGEIGGGYSTIPAFRKKKFAVPMKIQALFNTTMKGKNVPLSSFLRTDVIFFF